MGLNFEIRVDNVAQVQAGLDFLVDLWKIRTKDIFQEWGPELVTEAIDVSPEDKLRPYDRRRRPESEAFKNQWEFQVGYDADGPVLEVGNTDERMPLIVGPTSGTTITPKTAEFLWFYWDVTGGFVKAWEVTKKPTPGQPAHLWAIEQFDIDQHLPDLGNRLVR